MDYHNANSPAFPYTYTDREGDAYHKSGMTKREVITTQIMAALVESWRGMLTTVEIDKSCHLAATVADRLLHHLSKSEP